MRTVSWDLAIRCILASRLLEPPQTNVGANGAVEHGGAVSHCGPASEKRVASVHHARRPALTQKDAQLHGVIVPVIAGWRSASGQPTCDIGERATGGAGAMAELNAHPDPTPADLDLTDVAARELARAAVVVDDLPFVEVVSSAVCR
jgi:hypothetical protein